MGLTTDQTQQRKRLDTGRYNNRNYPKKAQKKKTGKKMNRASLSCETISNFVTRNWNLKRAGTPEMYLKK